VKRAFIALMAWLAATSLNAQPASWTTVPAGSSLAFTATFESAPAPGVFRKFDVSVRLDPANPAQGRVDVTIAVPSADMGSDDINKTIRSADWFDADRFPVAEFRASEVRASGPGQFVASGTLTLKGVSKPVAVPFAWTQAGDAATMTGEVIVDRGAFGIGAGQWQSTKQIAGEVKVRFSLQLRRTG
jgi:polyisoprenoid-binding protein YceI